MSNESRRAYLKLLGKRLSFRYPGFYAVIYTLDGQDPYFPIVGEIVQELGGNHFMTIPTKWSIKGEHRLSAPGEASRDPFDLPMEDLLVEASSVVYPMVANGN